MVKSLFSDYLKDRVCISSRGSETFLPLDEKLDLIFYNEELKGEHSINITFGQLIDYYLNNSSKHSEYSLRIDFPKSEFKTD
jgi:hypothetical protein